MEIKLDRRVVRRLQLKVFMVSTAAGNSSMGKGIYLKKKHSIRFTSFKSFDFNKNYPEFRKYRTLLVNAGEGW